MDKIAARSYARLIKAKRRTIEDVPEGLRKLVEDELVALG